MASVSGGLFQASPSSYVAGTQAKPSAGSLTLSSITSSHTTVSPDATGPSAFAAAHSAQPGLTGVTDKPGGPIAGQTQHGGNTVLHLHDGSTITIVGATHIDASFFH